MYSEVNRLMISPTVSDTPNPLSWSFPTAYRTMAVKMLDRWVSMIVGRARSYPFRRAVVRFIPRSRSSRTRS
jgi:hypothetical protein